MHTSQRRPRGVGRRLAHDPGDPLVTSHCPFCGSGQVVGRSDGTIGCDFCGQNYIVRVQPAFPGMPQMPMGPGAPSDVGPDGGLVDPAMIGPDGMPADEGGPLPGEDAESGDGPQDDAADGGSEDDDTGSGPPEKDDSPKKGKSKKESARRYRGLEGQRLTEEQLLRHVAVRVSGADPRVLAVLRAEGRRRRRPFGRTAVGRTQPSYVYHGFSVRLPPEVHAVVHDESRPEHERGFHLARYLLTHQPGDSEVGHPGQLLGQDWHRDSYWASRDADSVSRPRDAGRTPYVLKALAPSPEHVLSDDDRKGYPMWLHAGAPVHFTGLFWGHPESRVPGSPHEGKEGYLEFPEPVTSRA